MPSPGPLSLAAGTRLAHCEIVALLGVGGMGEVYRARDTKLQRDVALKVLPPDMTADPERRQVDRAERDKGYATGILPVIDNDSSSDCGILVISEFDPLPAEFGRIKAIYGGRALQVAVAEGATGTAELTYTITDGLPSQLAFDANAHALARYAALCQEAGIVPIVEPEVLQDGTHTIEESAKATGRVLLAVYQELHDQRVELAGTLLKPNMVLSGYSADNRAGIEEVADATLEVLYKHVPASDGREADQTILCRLKQANARQPEHVLEGRHASKRTTQHDVRTAWDLTNRPRHRPGNTPAHG